MKKPLATILLAAGLSAALIAPAHAQISPGGRTETRSVEISLADIDFASPDGLRTLETRVAKAVRHVCRAVDIDTGRRSMARDTRACLVKARASADRQLAALLGEARRSG